MALGGNVLRQHVVEFIRGTGIVTDGVIDATSLNGPWTWQVPDGVAELTTSFCGAGSSGGAGAYQAGALSAGGGAGGRGGEVVLDHVFYVVPRAILTITLGAGGVGTNSSDGANNTGGRTQISGLLPGFLVINNTATAKGGMDLWHYSWLGTAPTSSLSAVSTRGQGQSVDGTSGATSTQDVDATIFYAKIYAGNWLLSSNGGGGFAGGVVGGNGGACIQPYRTLAAYYKKDASNWSDTSTGTLSSGCSCGGGGRGSLSLFSGLAPAGGNGDAIGSSANSSSYGAGGGGGGGSGTARRAGGNGGDGYVRFTYWSMD